MIDKVASGSYLLPMRSVGLKILKNKLSEYVRLAAGGETVLVTDRDRVVAEIVPPQVSRGSRVADANLAELVRKRLLKPATIVDKGPPPSAPAMSLKEILTDLEEARADRDLPR